MHRVTVTLMDDLPVILNIVDDGVTQEDFSWAEAEWRRILDESPEPLFAIDDVTRLALSLGDMLTFATMGTRTDNPIWRHPRLRGLYFISTNRLIELGASGLNSATFGNVKARVFGTLDEALDDIRQIIAGGPPPG